MTILVTGATGNIGQQVVEQLVKRGADVRAFVRDPLKVKFSSNVTVVKGDFLDPESLYNAFDGVSTLFLLNAVGADEYTQALIALNVAKEAGIKNIVYFSVIHSDLYVNVPHFACKFGAERMIEESDFHATILRPAYFMSNELRIKDVVLNYNVYPMPIGNKGIAMISPQDVAEISAIELINRETLTETLPFKRINLVGPDILTGSDIAEIWTHVLKKPITYVGGDTVEFERNLRNAMPNWMAYDMKLMANRFINDGMIPEKGDVEYLENMLSRPLHTYREFAESIAN